MPVPPPWLRKLLQYTSSVTFFCASKSVLHWNCAYQRYGVSSTNSVSPVIEWFFPAEDEACPAKRSARCEIRSIEHALPKSSATRLAGYVRNQCELTA
jgi:hypothetical protein